MLRSTPGDPRDAEQHHWNIGADNEIEEVIFNSEITDDEIVFAVKFLIAGKSPGPDGIIPEMFMNTFEVILPILNKIFNRLFSHGQFQKLWSKSILIPLT